MKTSLIILISIVFFTGCVATTSQFANVYNSAVANGKSTTILKDGDFLIVKDNVNAHFKDVGYSSVLYSSPQEGFIVVFKDIPLAKAMLIGDAHPYKIILKYTKAGVGKTRIDLVNGSTGLFAQNEVQQDISQIAELLRAD